MVSHHGGSVPALHNSGYTHRVPRGQPRLPSQESIVPALANFGGTPVYMTTSFNAKLRFRRCDTYGEGRVLTTPINYAMAFAQMCRAVSQRLPSFLLFTVGDWLSWLRVFQ